MRPRSVPLPPELQALDPEIDIRAALNAVNALVADDDRVDWAVLRDTVRWNDLCAVFRPTVREATALRSVLNKNGGDFLTIHDATDLFRVRRYGRASSAASSGTNDAAR